MGDGDSDAGQKEGDLEITGLRLHVTDDNGAGPRRSRFKARTWQRLALGLALVLLVALLLGSQPFVQGTVRQVVSTALFPTPTPTAPAVPTATPLIAALPTPPQPLTPPTALPGVSAPPVLAPAPSSCGGQAPTLTQAGPPWNSEAIGRAPVLLSGFTGPYATARLGPAASALAYDWEAPYSQYGWPAPIGLIVQSDFNAPVTLSGFDLRTGYPVWFGFIVAGKWGAPANIMAAYTLDPSNPIVPVSGATASELFWYGYLFLPGAGCYTLTASWPGGSWQVTVSAGR